LLLSKTLENLVDVFPPKEDDIVVAKASEKNTEKQEKPLKLKVILVLAMMLCVSIAFASGGSVTGDSIGTTVTSVVPTYIDCVDEMQAFAMGTQHFTSAWGPERLEGQASFSGALAYANCPTVVTVTGNNPAGDNIPRLARAEVGVRADGFDRIPTVYGISVLANGDNYPITDWLDGSSQVPFVGTIAETPHNGYVGYSVFIEANGTTTIDPGCSVKNTYIDPNKSNGDSADAGVYEASLVFTLTPAL